MCLLNIVFSVLLINKLFHSQLMHLVNIQLNVFIITVEILGSLNMST